MAVRELTFRDVDGLGFAASCGALTESSIPEVYAPGSLGPLLELLHLAAGGQLPDPVGASWFRTRSAADLVRGLCGGYEEWFSPDGERIGFIRTKRAGEDGEQRFAGFLMRAQRAARNIARLPGSVPGQLAAAIEELEGNIHDHSDAVSTGLVAFRAADGTFEFVASDRGVGVLRSLRRCAVYESLADEGSALHAALTEGVSRYGPNTRHGNGFRPIFLGLMNLQGSLRFRSGNSALVMDGTSPSLAMAQIGEKPAIDGFFTSVTCRKS